jgi:M6 family metalloprotease-like protein
MQNIKHLLLITVILIIPCGAAATTAPKNGGKLPRAYLDARANDPTAFTMKRAWTQKAKQIREERQAFLAQRKANGLTAPAALPQQYLTAGTLRVPVLLFEFTNRSAPFDSITMQDQLFDNNPTGSITDYYDEVSYSNLTVAGNVYAPVTLSQSDVYYEGLPGCNGVCTSGHMGQIILETLDAKDPIVDFGQYDNDGSDGVPNSGDDDGFVDFVAFVHPEAGSECGSNNNLLSHTWEYAAWPESGGLPYITDDAAVGGGFIQISDYTMQPAKNCDNSTIIDIGVYCHEFGHGLGLPDLSDIYRNGSGIGWWGIMGSGNWNTPQSPAHPCAWTRFEMGWVTPIDIDWQGGIESIYPIFDTEEVFRLGFTNDRFRRSDECVIAGNYSLYCGLTQREGQGRGWGTELFDNGYGSLWTQTIQREFTFDGSTPVHFVYEYQHDTEQPNDLVYAIIDVQGTETVLESYTGQGSGSANHDISSYLSGLTPPAKYTLKFRGTSDYSWSDEDTKYDSDCGLLVVDDVAVCRRLAPVTGRARRPGVLAGRESSGPGFRCQLVGWGAAHNARRRNRDQIDYGQRRQRRIAARQGRCRGRGRRAVAVGEGAQHG